MALSGSKPYFFNILSSTIAEMSNKGFPQPNKSPSLKYSKKKLDFIYLLSKSNDEYLKAILKINFGLFLNNNENTICCTCNEQFVIKVSTQMD